MWCLCAAVTNRSSSIIACAILMADLMTSHFISPTESPAMLEVNKTELVFAFPDLR